MTWVGEGIGGGREEGIYGRGKKEIERKRMKEWGEGGRKKIRERWNRMRESEIEEEIKLGEKREKEKANMPFLKNKNIKPQPIIPILQILSHQTLNRSKIVIITSKVPQLNLNKL